MINMLPRHFVLESKKFCTHLPKRDAPPPLHFRDKKLPCVFWHGSLLFLYLSSCKISHICQGFSPVQLLLFYFLILRRLLPPAKITVPDTSISTRYAAHGVLSAVCTELELVSELAVPLEADPFSEM